MSKRAVRISFGMLCVYILAAGASGHCSVAMHHYMATSKKSLILSSSLEKLQPQLHRRTVACRSVSTHRFPPETKLMGGRNLFQSGAHRSVSHSIFGTLCAACSPASYSLVVLHMLLKRSCEQVPANRFYLYRSSNQQKLHVA